MDVNTLIQKLKDAPQTVEFDEIIAVIDDVYNFSPTTFTNGETKNEQGQNNGSCKIFAFAKLNGLTKEQALACFGRYYREDVLENPDGTDHQNIRNFMKTGWEGITFFGEALSLK
ncbi:HopJ type III effector protein [Vibrio sp. TRT 17S01]|uniref:HopJ type III effector protein n=1 Tax=Vibrio sp. TRT 17S01 TaxID=3418505 RepID=UPI003CF083CD